MSGARLLVERSKQRVAWTGRPATLLQQGAIMSGKPPVIREISSQNARWRGRGLLGCCTLVASVEALGACGSAESASKPPAGEAVPPSGARPDEAEPVEARSAWVFPEGGVAVDAIPSTDHSVRAIDAHGNLWIPSCEGLYVASDSEIRRYRYLDTPWERGGNLEFADQQGRIWYSSDRGLSVLEAGQWQDVSADAGAGLVVGSDGVAWVVNYGERSGNYTIASVWPEASAPIVAPRWHFQTFAGQNGGIWYRTFPSSASELWHFDGQRFSGPFTVDNGLFFYDSLDDTMGIVRWEQRELIKVRYDGTDIVEVSRSAVDWRDALGRQIEGYLIARNDQNELLVLDGERALPLPELTRRTLGRSRQINGRLSATGELYLLTEGGVFHYRDGQARPVVEYAPYVPEVRPWDSTGYARALRAESTTVTRADFEPEIPSIFGEKVRITGISYYTGFETPNALAVDGEPVNVSVQPTPELYAFATEHELDLGGPESAMSFRDPNAEPWDLIGYLEPGPCYRPGEKTFHLIEAYPQSMPPAERAELEAELRERYAP
jgi:hypothetical protein